MKCPKCGIEQAGTEQCDVCGVIFEKYRRYLERLEQRYMSMPTSKRTTGSGGKLFWVVGLVVAATALTSYLQVAGKEVPVEPSRPKVAEPVASPADNAIAAETAEDMEFLQEELRKAIRLQKHEQVDSLIRKGVDLEHRWNDKTPLLMALSYPHCDDESANILIDAGADTQAANGLGQTALALAVGCKPEVFEKILKPTIQAGMVDARDQYQRTALHAAAIKVRPDIAALLLKAGADVNAVDWQGWTPLHYVTSRNFAIRYRPQEQIAQILLDAGAMIDIANREGETPLTLALSGEIEVAKLLRAKELATAPKSGREVTLEKGAITFRLPYGFTAISAQDLGSSRTPGLYCEGAYTNMYANSNQREWAKIHVELGGSNGPDEDKILSDFIRQELERTSSYHEVLRNEMKNINGKDWWVLEFIEKPPQRTKHHIFFLGEYQVRVLLIRYAMTLRYRNLDSDKYQELKDDIHKSISTIVIKADAHG